jgi:hypothetical protein
VYDLGREVQGLGLRAKGLGFRMKGLGFRVQGLVFIVQGLGFIRVPGVDCRMWGSGFRDQDVDCRVRV